MRQGEQKYSTEVRQKKAWLEKRRKTAVFTAITGVVCCIAVAGLVFGGAVNKQKKEQNTENLPVVATPAESTTPKDSEVSAESTTPEVTTPQETTPASEETTTPLPVEQYPGGFEFEQTGDKKYAYLTFDDGPSESTYTILDILDQYGVKATFFVNGRTDEASLERYHAIVDRGHSLGMHSYSHDYENMYASVENFAADTQRIHDLIRDITGQDVRVYRFPGGSSNTISPVDMNVYMDYLTSIGYVYYDWNVSSEDATGRAITAEEIVANVLNQSAGLDRAMILMHDGKKKQATVQALPAMIEGLKASGFEIVPITERTKPVQHRKAAYMQQS